MSCLDLPLPGCRLRLAGRAVATLFKLSKKVLEPVRNALVYHVIINALENVCLLYTSDAADE